VVVAGLSQSQDASVALAGVAGDVPYEQYPRLLQ